MNFTDPVTDIIVDGSFIYGAQVYVENIFENDKEKSFYMCDGLQIFFNLFFKNIKNINNFISFFLTII